MIRLKVRYNTIEYLRRPKLTKSVKVTPKRSSPSTDSSRVSLVSTRLSFDWKTSSDSYLVDPTSIVDSHILDKAFSAIISQHLVRYALSTGLCPFLDFSFARRYPLIFGPWGGVSYLFRPSRCILITYQMLAAGQDHFSSIARSLISMIERSPNARFQRKMRRYLEVRG